MISTRILFVFMALMLVMVIDVSMAPVYEEDGETTETIIETTDVPDVVTDHLLFFDVSAMPSYKNVETGDKLLYNKQGAVLVTPSPDESHLFTIEIPHVTGNISYNES